MRDYVPSGDRMSAHHGAYDRVETIDATACGPAGIPPQNDLRQGPSIMIYERKRSFGLRNPFAAQGAAAKGCIFHLPNVLEVGARAKSIQRRGQGNKKQCSPFCISTNSLYRFSLMEAQDPINHEKIKHEQI